MLILKQFFEELENIQYLRSSPTRDQNYKDQFELYDEYLTARLDFETKYIRILRGLDLLSDEDLIMLKAYYDKAVIPCEKDYKHLCDIIVQVETAV
jgi:hypothetical protein